MYGPAITSHLTITGENTAIYPDSTEGAGFSIKLLLHTNAKH